MNIRLISLLTIFAAAQALADDIPRTSDGKPDFTGYYDIATLTPLQRPAEFGDNLYLTPAQAEEMREEQARVHAEGDAATDPNRTAPPTGGDGSEGAAGNVGGYNAFWIDNGESAAQMDGKFRTSIIYEPANGRWPQLTPAALKRFAERRRMFRENQGVAWWLDEAGPGPYDGPESRTLSDRCLLGFGSTAGPPMLPVLYNNLKRFVQTPTHLVILNEMVHDARIIRIDGEHAPEDVRAWFGDSVGWWDGDTLVVETTNFGDRTSMYGGTRNMKVTERFSWQDSKTLRYNFTVEDPSVWAEPWSGEFPFPKSENVVYEYACHEANYAMGNILRGARILERDRQQQDAGVAGGGGK